jgi:hypothetical protein
VLAPLALAGCVVLVVGTFAGAPVAVVGLVGLVTVPVAARALSDPALAVFVALSCDSVFAVQPATEAVSRTMTNVVQRMTGVARVESAGGREM